MSAAALDPAEFASEDVLAKRRARDLRLFRSAHRLAGPVVLFAGAYTRDAGLAEAIALANRLSAEIPELRLVALPFGRVHRRYLDRCEREALRLGHRGIVEWQLDADDVPLWFAVADVVVVPGEKVDPVAVRLAEAAGVPIVGREREAASLDAAVRALLPEPEPRASGPQR